MAFFTSQFSNKTMASGIKEVDSQLSLVNMVRYKLIEYNEIKEEPKDFCQPPIKVKILPPHDSDSIGETSVHKITFTNLDEIEKIIRQDMSSDIIMITDEEDPQILNYDNEAEKLDQATGQDLQVISENDEATVNLINMIRFNDMVHEGRDEATINLVTKLEAEIKAEDTHFNKEKDKVIEEKTTKNVQNFSPLSKPKKQ